MPIASVRADVKATKKNLSRIQKRQIPFATSNAINRTAFDGQRELKKQAGIKFILRNRFVESGFFVIKASKRKLTARVLVGKGREFLSYQVFGGTKTGQGSIAIPVKIRSNPRQKITRGKKPRAVLAKPRHFIATIGTGQRGIFRRRTKKRLPISRVFDLEQSVKIKPRFPFFKIVGGIVKSKFKRHLEQSLKEALRSAR